MYVVHHHRHRGGRGRVGVYIPDPLTMSLLTNLTYCPSSPYPSYPILAPPHPCRLLPPPYILLGKDSNELGCDMEEEDGCDE